MIGRIEMRAVVRHQPDPLDGPTLAIRQILFAQAGKEFDDIGRGVAMRQVLDARPIARRIGDDVILERHRDIDQASRHDGVSGG
jgi:hypothetical protein